MTHLAFWLFNVTILLHFIRCDRIADEKCIDIDADMVLEDLINAIFVYIVRGIEQSIDEMIDTCFIEHAPLADEFESLQFEGEWSFFKSLTPKKRQAPPPSYSLFSQSNGDMAQTTPHGSPRPDSRPDSPGPGVTSSPGLKGFSLRNTLTRKQTASAILAANGSPSSGAGDSAPPGNRISMDVAPPVILGPNPADVTALLGAAHTLLTLYGVNPTLIVQLFSQVLSWAACEVFNRILTRKKYLCRSRAMQINMNISVIEEWAITDAGLPRGTVSHFAPVRELLRWLQVSTSHCDVRCTLKKSVASFVDPRISELGCYDSNIQVAQPSSNAAGCAGLQVRKERRTDERRMRPVLVASPKGLGKAASQARCRGSSTGREYLLKYGFHNLTSTSDFCTRPRVGGQHKL
jgi:hypothetical protein